MTQNQPTTTERASAAAARAEFEQRHPISAPIGQDVPAPRLDSQGNHLQLYGQQAPHDATTALRRLGVPAGLQVASRREKTLHGGRAQVVLFSHDGPFNLDFRLSPADARELAASLLLAADACDTLERRISAERKPRKTTAATQAA